MHKTTDPASGDRASSDEVAADRTSIGHGGAPARRVGIVALLVIALLGIATARPQTVQGVVSDGFNTEFVIEGLSRPTNVEFASNGRVFISEQSGLIKTYDSINDRTATITADLKRQVHAVGGRGLLGLALDPNYPATPHLYVLYSLDGPIGSTPPTYGSGTAAIDTCPTPPGPGRCVAGARLSRLDLNAQGVSQREVILLEDWCAEWQSHSIGDLKFGPDGYLYASAGDGAFAGQPDYGQRPGSNGCDDPPTSGALTLQNAEGGALRSQDPRTPNDPTSLMGTVIRVDKRTGRAAPGNPNFGASDPNAARVIAHGFRNPFRLEFRPGTDDLFIADVGWNRWEEFNKVDTSATQLGNYGWPCFEGHLVKAYDIGLRMCEDLYDDGAGAVTSPWWAYEQKVGIAPGDPCQDEHGSPSGLEFYSGTQYPAKYRGALFFADYARRCAWVMPVDSAGRPQPDQVEFVLNSEAVTDIETGPNGDIFMLSIFGEGNGGSLLRLTANGGTNPPTAVIDADPASGPAPLRVEFDARRSTPGSAGETLRYAWDLDDDGDFDDATGATTEFMFRASGTHTVRVRVTGSRSGSSTASTTVTVGGSVSTQIQSPAPGTTWKVGDIISFSGAVDVLSGASASTTKWDVILHHCETVDDCHTHLVTSIEDSLTGQFEAPEHEYPSFLELRFTAAGDDLVPSTSSLELFPATSLLRLRSEPTGVELGFNGVPSAAPSDHEVIVGTSNIVRAPATSEIGGTTYEFVGWADGGDAVREVVVNSATTLRARYRAVSDGGTTGGGSSGGDTGGVTVTADPASSTSPAVTVTRQGGALEVTAAGPSSADRYQLRYRQVGRRWTWTSPTPASNWSASDPNSEATLHVEVRALVSGRWRTFTRAVVPAASTGGSSTGGTTTDGGTSTGGTTTDGGTSGGHSGTSVTQPGASSVSPTVTVTPTGDGFDVSWTSVNRSVRYQVKYQIVGQKWSWLPFTTATSAQVDGLAPGTYRVAVRALVDRKWRAWTTVTISR